MNPRQERSGEFRDPRATARARLEKLAPLVLGCAGMAGSILLAGNLWLSERNAARAGFELDSAKLMAAVGRELQVHFEQVRAVSALFQSSQLVEPREFRTFTAPSFARYPALEALFWIESEEGAVGAPSVRLSEGPEAKRSLPGLTVETSPGFMPLVERAAARRALTLSAPIERDGDVRILVLEPALYLAHGTAFAGGLFDVGLLFENARTALVSTDVLVDAQDAEFPGLSLSGLSALSDRPPWYGIDLDLGGRTWHLGSAPPAGYLAARATWRPWIGLAFGLLATGLLLATVAMATGRERILRLVEGRTKEVRQAYETLSHEAKERMWATNERRLIGQQLRAVIDLVPDRIFVKDGMGRFLLANRAAAEAYGTTVDKLTATRYVDRNGPPLHVKEPLDEEQRAMIEQRASVLPALPFVDTQGRRRVFRQTMTPCNVFGERLNAMLCVATDITEQKQAEEILRAQNRLLSELARGEDPERVLAQIVHAAEQLIPDMRASVLFLSADGHHLKHGFAPSLPPEYNSAIDGLAIGERVGSCGAAAFLGERFVVADVMKHPNWESYRDLAKRCGIGACWSQPIRAADETILGTFALYYGEPREPEPYEEGFIETMAHIAGIAIERARIEARP